ncbi:MAG: hypothetical protein ACTHQQ_12710 [Solirubrobacteraceae bacterium]
MATDHSNSSPKGVLHGITSIPGRAAAVTMKPVTEAVSAAAEAGLGVQRRAIDRLLDSGELEQLLASPRLQALVEQVLDSDGAQNLIDTFFESGLFDRLIERLLASDGLWHAIDVIAASPAVRAAISQQGLGFADQVAGVVRRHSRSADDSLERAAQRLIHPGQEPPDGVQPAKP